MLRMCLFNCNYHLLTGGDAVSFPKHCHNAHCACAIAQFLLQMTCKVRFVDTDRQVRFPPFLIHCRLSAVYLAGYCFNLSWELYAKCTIIIYIHKQL